MPHRKPSSRLREFFFFLITKPHEVTTWMNFENIMLSKKNQTQRAIHCIIPLI